MEKKKDLFLLLPLFCACVLTIKEKKILSYPIIIHTTNAISVRWTNVFMVYRWYQRTGTPVNCPAGRFSSE